MALPSEFPFSAYLQYAPHQTGEAGARWRSLRDAIKHDSFLYPMKRADGTIGRLRAIDTFCERMAALIQAGSYPFFAQYFGHETLLVPMPRSAPLADKSALWPGLRICSELKKQGLAADVLPLLERVKAVPKAAFARPGERPGPFEHYQSTCVDPAQPRLLPGITRITLVDDIVTRGASFLGMVPHITEAFPGLEVRCFALVRTESYKDITDPLDPVEGKIELRGGNPLRTP